MSTGWVAASTRGKALLRRRLGQGAALRLAALPSLGAAVEQLGSGPYGRTLKPGMGLAEAQRAVSATTLWHLRILAGWGPPFGTDSLRAIAGRFEIANISGHLAGFADQPAPAPFDLGTLATAWPAVSRSASVPEVRSCLRSSPWGDPGSDDPAAIRVALELAWARRLTDSALGTAELAAGWATLVIARAMAAGAAGSISPAAARDATRVLGPRWSERSSLEDLSSQLPRAAAGTLAGVATPEELWRAEFRWWSSVEATGASLVARPRPSASTGVGVAAQLTADSWRVRAALSAAAHGGMDLREELGGVA